MSCLYMLRGTGGRWGDARGSAGRLAARAGVLSLCLWPCAYLPWQQSIWEPCGTKRVLKSNQIGWKEKGETLGPNRLPLVWAFHLQVTRSAILNKPCTWLTDSRKAATSRLSVGVLFEMKGLKRALKKCLFDLHTQLQSYFSFVFLLWRIHWNFNLHFLNCLQKNSFCKKAWNTTWSSQNRAGLRAARCMVYRSPLKDADTDDQFSGGFIDGGSSGIYTQ